MLYFDLDRLFTLRGIKHPYKFLIDHGFAPSTAVRFVNKRVDNMNLVFVEKLCRLFKCTPNDLLAWSPAKDELVSDSNPLKILLRNDDYSGISKLMKSLPLSELEQFMKSFSENKEKQEK